MLDSGEDDEEPLCCCEYISDNGERSHLCGLFCDCEALDDTFERLMRREPMPEGRLGELGAVLQDRLRIPWISGAKRIDPTTLLPFIILPILGLLATIGPVWTFLAFLLLPILTQILRKKVLVRSQQTKFYCSFMLASFLYSYMVFILEVYGADTEIHGVETTVHLILLLLVLGCMYKTKRKGSKDSSLLQDKLPFYYFCRTCQFYVDGRDHHCVWLDCCIGKRNRGWFLVTLLLSSAWVYFTITLTLSSICFPWFAFHKLVFIPLKCHEVYEGFRGSICFVTVLYGGVVLLLLFAILFHQLRMVSKGMSYLDWKYQSSASSSRNNSPTQKQSGI